LINATANDNDDVYSYSWLRPTLATFDYFEYYVYPDSSHPEILSRTEKSFTASRANAVMAIAAAYGLFHLNVFAHILSMTKYGLMNIL